MAKFSIPVQKSIKVAFPAPQSFAFITLEPIIKEIVKNIVCSFYQKTPLEFSVEPVQPFMSNGQK